MDIFNHYIEPMIQWLHIHPHWAGVITFIVAFGESLAIVGTIIPGSVTMTAVGVLIGGGVIPFYSTLLYAILGAIAGDSASYFLGYYYHAQIAELWPFTRYPTIITKGKAFFILHGGKSVFIGRFLGPLRSIIPVVAGMMRMSNGRFLVANATSAVLWSILYIGPGILIGAATTELSAETASKLFFYLFISLISIWLFTWFLKGLITVIRRFSVKHLNQFWQWMRAHPKLQALAMWLSDPEEPHALTQLYFTLIAFICLVLFVLITLNVKSHGYLTHYNSAIFYLMQSIRFPILDKFFTLLTYFGDKLVILPLALIVSFYLYLTRHKWAAYHLLSNTFLTAILIKLSKSFVHYPRPTGLVITRHGFSFPSGHTGISIAVLGFIAFLLSKQTTLSMKRFIWFPVISFFILISLSRIYLGAHWISDLMGAYSLVGFVLFAHIVSYNRRLAPAIGQSTFTVLTLSVMMLAASVMTYCFYTEDLSGSQLKRFTTTIPLSTWWDENNNIFPLYRNNRLGKPINKLNIQWAAPLSEITTVLSDAGWQTPDNQSMQTVISNLMSKSATERLPILTPLYLNQRPALTMTYEAKDAPLTILNLWPSYIKFKNTTTPLWVGAIYRRHRQAYHYEFFNRTLIRNKSLPAPQEMLSSILAYFDWKKISVEDGKAFILLIKAR